MKDPIRTFLTRLSSSDGICAPVTGRSVSLQQVEDEVFSRNILGEGMAFRPDKDILHAPFTGKVTRILANGQVIWLEGKQGMTFLIQIGISPDEGQDLKVEVAVRKGDAVKVGDELARFDLEQLLSSDKTGLVVIVGTSIPSKKKLVSVAPEFVIGGRDPVFILSG